MIWFIDSNYFEFTTLAQWQDGGGDAQLHVLPIDHEDVDAEPVLDQDEQFVIYRFKFNSPILNRAALVFCP